MLEKLKGNALSVWFNGRMGTHRGGVGTGFLYSQSHLCAQASVALRSQFLTSNSLFLTVYSTLTGALRSLYLILYSALAGAIAHRKYSAPRTIRAERPKRKGILSRCSVLAAPQLSRAFYPSI